MTAYTVTGPDGHDYEFDGPENATEQQIKAYAKQLYTQRQQDIAPAKGMGEAFMGGAKRMGSSTLTGLAGILDAQKAGEEGVARGNAITEKSGASLDKLKSVYNEQGLYPAIKEGISQIPTTLAEQAPNLATTFAGARLGGMAGAAVGGPFGAGIGALGGMALASYLPQAGGNIERQVQEGKSVDKAAAYGAAVPQAAIDVFADKIAFGKLLGLPAAKLGTHEAEKLAKESVSRSLAVGTAKGIFAEVPGEVTQQVLERYQAGLPLTDDSARKEYADTAYQTAMLGPIGALSRFSEKGEAKNKLAEDKAVEQAKIDKNVAAVNAKYLADDTRRSQDEQDLADVAGTQSVQDEIKRQADETRTNTANALRQVLAQKQAEGVSTPTNEPSTDSTVAEPTTAPAPDPFTLGENLEIWGIKPRTTKQRNALAEKLKPYNDLTDPANVTPATEILHDYANGPNTPKDQRDAAQKGIDHLNEIAGIHQQVEAEKFNLQPTETPTETPNAEEGQQVQESKKQLKLFDKNGQPTRNSIQPVDEATATDSATTGENLGPDVQESTQGQANEVVSGTGVQPATGLTESEPSPVVPRVNNKSTTLEAKQAKEALAKTPIEDIWSDFSDTPFTQLDKTSQIRIKDAHKEGYLNQELADEVDRIASNNLIKEKQNAKAHAEEADNEAAIAVGKRAKDVVTDEPAEEGPNTDHLDVADEMMDDMDLDPELSKGTVKKNLKAMVSTGAITKEQAASYDSILKAKDMHAEDVLGEIRTDLEHNRSNLKMSKKPKGKNAEEKVTRSEPSEVKSSVEEVNKHLKAMLSPNRLAQRAPIVVEDYSHLPEDIRSQAEKAEAKAFVDPKTGQDYYIANQIPLGDERGTIMHELGVHLGLSKLIGNDRINALSNRIYAWAAENKNNKENKIAMEAFEKADASGEAVHSQRYNEEVVAYFTEIAVNRYNVDPLKTQPRELAKVAGWVRELWTGIMATIRKLHYNPQVLNAKDIVQLVYGAARIEANLATKVATRETEIQASKGKVQPTSQDLANASAANRNFYYEKNPPTLKERVQSFLGSDWTAWLGNKVVGGGTALELHGIKMFGAEARINAATGKEHGYLNYHRALHDTDLATGAVQYGYLEFDNEGVAHVRDSADNMMALNKVANDIKAAMMADGMSEVVANDAFSHMRIAERYKELISMGVLDPDEFSDADYAYGKQMQAKYSALDKQWLDMHQRIRTRTMDTMVKSGTFTKEKAKEFLDRLEYIPFNREQDEGVSDGVFLQGLMSAKTERHIKGSGRSVKDIMANITDNQVWLIKRAVKNNASNLIADTLTEMNRQNPLMGGMAVRFDDKKGQTISYLKDGKTQFFKMLDKNDAAIFSTAPAVSNSAIRIMRMFTGYLRKGVTLMPSFHYGQIIQDAMRAPIVAGTKSGTAGLMKTSIPEFIGNVGKHETPLAKSLRRAGIIGQIDYQDTYDNWRKEMLDKDQRTAIGHVLEKAERVAQANDMSSRASVYKDIMDNGGSENEASLRAMMMINFQNHGQSSVMSYLMATVPFVNSRIQGEYRLMLALTGRIPGVTKAHAKQLIMWRAAKFAAYVAIYAMASSGNDDYERANEGVKNNNFLVGGVKIPVAPEFIPLKVGIEKAYRLATDQQFETAGKAARAEMGALAGLLIGAGDVTPTMIKPMLENMTNYSFFSGRTLVGYNQLSKDTNLQFNEGTSDFSKGLSNMLQSVGGNTVNISPIKMDNLIRGLFGTMGRDLLFTTDMIAGDKPAQKWNQMPVMGGMFYDMEGGALKSDFYDLKDQADRAGNSLKDISEKGDPEKTQAYVEKYKSLLAVRSGLDSISNQLNEVRKYKAYITQSDPDHARERISELDTRVHEMLKEKLPLIMRAVNGG